MSGLGSQVFDPVGWRLGLWPLRDFKEFEGRLKPLALNPKS